MSDNSARRSAADYPESVLISTPESREAVRDLIAEKLHASACGCEDFRPDEDGEDRRYRQQADAAMELFAEQDARVRADERRRVAEEIAVELTEWATRQRAQAKTAWNPQVTRDLKAYGRAYDTAADVARRHAPGPPEPAVGGHKPQLSVPQPRPSPYSGSRSSVRS